jgi:tetratricopeptide (TPR) repeat protein
LTYLGDPLKLADHVLHLLRQNRFDEAELLVQTASKRFPCTVSWNHLMDWQLSQGKVNTAIKTYNAVCSSFLEALPDEMRVLTVLQMKKRGQKPDAHTYTILFRGLAEYAHYPEALSKALSIYHSMDADSSPVQPNVFHTNAVLKVCARAKDMDALYGIVAKLRRKGVRAPNNLTYTTILNAIRQQAVEVSAEVKDEAESRAICQRAIIEARKLWIEIIERWRQGDIFIDEEVTCSMGRILLMGEKQEVDDVFSLIEQAMNIPRLVPRIGADFDNQMDSAVHGEAKDANADKESSLLDDNTEDKLRHDGFNVITRPKQLMKHSDAYAKPGRNSLSLVLEALKERMMRRPLAAYWDIFTNTYKVNPDSNNFHIYLQNLRMQRASSDTVNILQQMPREMLQMKTFRIAMSTCARDKKNQNSFANAGKVLDLMQQSLSDLDLPTLHKYMEVALYSYPNQDALATGRGNNELDYARGRQILRALARLGPCVINVRSALAYTARPQTRQVSKSEPVTDQAAALALVREMISAYDKLMNNGMVPQEMNKALKLERSKLAAFVTRYKAGPRKPVIGNVEAEVQKSPFWNTVSRGSRLWSASRVPARATV